ncbi:MAG: hypothetical protein IT195_00040 [Microthrixaceae bacterium]|nr:hypothetical protein [Microthrixaceae bacterium]
MAVPVAAYEDDSDGVETREVWAESSVGVRAWTLDPGSGRPVVYHQDVSGTADDRVSELLWGPDGRLVSVGFPPFRGDPMIDCEASHSPAP